MSSEERFYELWVDDDVFNDWVKQWMEKHPDKVFDIIADYLANQVTEPVWNQEQDEFRKYVNDLIEAEKSEAQERAYERRKEDEYERRRNL